VWVGLQSDNEFQNAVGLKPGPEGTVWVGLQSDNEFQNAVGLKPDPQGAVWVGLQSDNEFQNAVGLKPDPQGAVWVGLQSDNEFQKNCRVKTRPTGSGGFCGSGFIPTRCGKLKRNVGLKPDPRGAVWVGLQSDNEFQKNCRVKTRPTGGSGFCGSDFSPTMNFKTLSG